MEEGIKEERKRLKFLRERADYLIDSSHMLTRELRAELSKIFVENKEYKNLYISVLVIWIQIWNSGRCRSCI